MTKDEAFEAIATCPAISESTKKRLDKAFRCQDIEDNRIEKVVIDPKTVKIDKDGNMIAEVISYGDKTM